MEIMIDEVESILVERIGKSVSGRGHIRTLTIERCGGQQQIEIHLFSTRTAEESALRIRSMED